MITKKHTWAPYLALFACTAVSLHADVLNPRFRSSRIEAPEKKIAKSTVTSDTPESTQPIRRRRGRKRNAQTASQKRVTLNAMTYEQLKDAKDSRVAQGNKESALIFLERMLKMCDDVHEIAGLMVEVSDILFDQGQTTRAEKSYHEFTKLYPGSDRTEYALYRAILCSFYQILDADRDQTKTHDTIELIDQFLVHETFEQYKEDVNRIRLTCYERLIESEFIVCDFYLKNNRYNAVAKRLDTVRTDWLAKVPGIETKLLTFEYNLFDTMQDPRAEQKQTELVALLEKTNNIAHGSQKNCAERF